MFGGLRKRVTNETIAATRQLVSSFQLAHGIPRGFWQDDFIVGYFGNTIGVYSRMCSGDRLSQTEKGYLLCEVFEAISNSNGSAIVRRFTEMAFQSPRPESFQRGLDFGEIVTLAMLGKVTDLGRPFVEDAKRIAAERGQQHDVNVVVQILLQKLFLEPIEARFSLG